MKIELMVKWTDVREDEDFKEELKMKKLLGEIEDGEPIKQEKVVTYGPLVIDAKDIKSFNWVDDNHTVIRMYDGESYCINMPYEIWSEVFIRITGETIIKYTDIAIRKKEEPKRRSRKEDKDEEDNINLI